MKKNFKSLFAVLLAICIFATSVFFGSTVFAATPKGAISKVQNVTSGIKVTWTKDTTKTGYYVYRRASGSSTWKQIKKVTSKSTLTFTDKNVTNGSRYTYRVRSYKGSKITKETKEKAIYRLTTPSITSISSNGVGSIYVKTGTNKKASGYEIKYATKSDFSNAKTLKCAGTKTVNTTICNLSSGTTYYVKVRAYYNASNVLHYSAYSSVKTCTTKSGYTAYTKHLNTSIYSSASTSSTKTTLRYMSKVSILSVYSIKSGGIWQKVSYNGKTYYTWLTDGVSDKFTTTKNTYTYTGNTEYQQAVIDFAIGIFKKGNTEYAHTKNDAKNNTGELNSNGKYGYDCSGFTSYVMDTVMSKYVPMYHINAGIEAVFNTGVIYNGGYGDAEFSAKTVCEGTLDYSKMQPGDLIFWNLEGGSKNSFPWNHVGIYLGKKQFIHSTPDADGIAIYPLEDSYVRDFVKVTRVIPTEITPINETKTLTAGKTFYKNANNKDGTIGSIPNGATVLLLYVNYNENYGYVEYDGQRGYIYRPNECLA